jgi:hypothetical protein
LPCPVGDHKGAKSGGSDVISCRWGRDDARTLRCGAVATLSPQSLDWVIADDDVFDPYGMSLAEHRRTAEDLDLLMAVVAGSITTWVAPK